MSLLRIGCCFFVAACGVADAADAPWRHMAEQDLAAMHDAIRDRHPGPVDPRNPAFADWHERGYTQALARAAKAADFSDYEAALRYYVNGFRDGHLGMQLDMQASRAWWPGVVVAWRGDEIRVHHLAADVKGPRVGDVLVSCDGVAADRLFADRVSPYYGNPEIPSSRVLHVPKLLVGTGPAAPTLKSCTFRGEGGERAIELAWNRMPMERLAPMMRAAAAGEPPELGIRKLAGNGTWISLPSFSVGGAQIDALKATLAELPKHRDSAYVVIDVRGNGGGSSHWGRQVIDGLYGADFGKWLQAEADRKTKDVYVEFRVSQETADHFRNELPRLAAGAGKDSTDYRYFERIVADMDAALLRKEVLLDDRPAQRAVFGPPVVETGPKPAAAYSGHVYFLTDALCASACLDFADLLLDAPNVVQVGEPTSGDTVYMDLGFMRLPSNAGGFSYATKVYRGRPRGHNVAYVPKHEWKGDVWRTPELERWIAEIESKR